MSLAAARLLLSEKNYPGCANRAYYAGYQAATVVCLEHGDAGNFPAGWNNPSHDQLPQLIQNNGDLPVATRRSIASRLIHLRGVREDSDYRPGRTVDAAQALQRVHHATYILQQLGFLDEGE